MRYKNHSFMTASIVLQADVRIPAVQDGRF